MWWKLQTEETGEPGTGDPSSVQQLSDSHGDLEMALMVIWSQKKKKKKVKWLDNLAT